MVEKKEFRDKVVIKYRLFIIFMYFYDFCTINSIDYLILQLYYHLNINRWL